MDKGYRVTPSRTQLYAFTNAFQPVRRAWLQAAAATVAKSGVSFSIATAILHLSRMGGGVQQSVLAEEAGVNPAAMLRTLDQAEAAGLIEKRGVVGNRRIKAIYLLPAGEEIVREIETALSELRNELLHDVAAGDVEGATRLLRSFEARITEHMQQQNNAPANP